VEFFSDIRVKPWLESQVEIDNAHSGGSIALPKEKLALRVFVGVVGVVFSLSVVAYSDRMILADWSPVPEPLIMWINLAVLLASSVAMQWAVVNSHRDKMANVEVGLLVGGAFALAFLAGQLLVVRQLDALGYFAPTNPALAFLYMLSALHAIHLIGGLYVWGRTVLRIWRGYEARKVYFSVELCAFYWHFLLALWLVLFVWFVIT
jgi:cytochrome c oxidase subunit 3